MNGPYAGIYHDAYGQESVDITVEEDGQFLAMTVRGVHFRGLGFDFFYVWPVDQDAEKRRQFHVRTCELLTKERVELLCLYTLQWTMPLPVVKQSQVLTGLLSGNYAEAPYGPSHIRAAAHRTLVLQVEGRSFEATSNRLSMETALVQFQQQLPSNMYLKCCQFCRFSAYEPFGGSGYLCFRNKKEAICAVKHQPQPHSKFQIAALRNEGEVNFVQENYLCPEFEIDLIWLEIVRQAEQ